MKGKSKFQLIVIILEGVLVISLSVNGYLFWKWSDERRVVKVLDGDTLVLKSGAVVRMAGASAPEYDGCLGRQPEEKLAELVLNKVVRLTGKGHDNYGRLISRVWVGKRSVEKAMIQSGMARIEYAMDSDNSDLSEAQKSATERRVGVFGDQCTIQPNDERMKGCRVKGNVDDSTKKKYYHLPGCPHYDQVVISLDTGDVCFKTEHEAIEAGFVKAKGCEL